MTLLESQNLICRILMQSLNKVVRKFVAKLIKYKIEDILTFLGLFFRDASLITLYLIIIGISIPKIR